MIQETDKSYGVLPYRKEPKKPVEILLVLHQAGHWHFPKGRADYGEKPLDTARRELREEVGLGLGKVLNPDKPIIEKYSFTLGEVEVHKTVELYIAEVIGEFITLQPAEIAKAQWLPYQKALETLTYEGTKACLKAARNYLPQ